MDRWVAVMTMTLFAGSGFSAENVKSWGTGWYGQLGNGVSYFWEDDQQQPPGVVPGLSGVKAVTTGAGFSLALKTDGTVWAWGSINRSNVPVPVNGLTGVTAMAGGGAFQMWEPWTPDPYAVFLKSDGTVWVWDDSLATPVAVPTLTGVKAIGDGADEAFAIQANGTVWKWCHGCTSGGQVPALVSELTNVKALAPDASGINFVLRNDGTVWVWDMWAGAAPVQVPGLSGVVEIAPYIAR